MDKHQLKQYIGLGLEIEQLEEEIMRLESSLLSTPCPRNDGMPRSVKPYHDNMAEAVAKLVDLINILQNKVELYRSSRLEIERAIEVLDSADRLLMRLRYIKGKIWEDVAEELGYSYQAVHWRHKNILRHMEKD